MILSLFPNSLNNDTLGFSTDALGLQDEPATNGGETQIFVISFLQIEALMCIVL